MISERNYKVFSTDKAGFPSLALDVFRFQYTENRIYRSYCDAIGINAEKVDSVSTIPFLPIRFFKSHEVISGEFEPVRVFESSGTTGTVSSRHVVKDLSLYEKSFMDGFTRAYGQPSEYSILGLLPSYLERNNSSLVYMVDRLIKESDHPSSGFYLDDLSRLRDTLVQNENSGKKTLLIGVTFALLDFAEKYPVPLKNAIIMETGGMKGRRKEIVRDEVHDILKSAFKVETIHSEYGMTELLSQAYSKGHGLFSTPPWMKVIPRDEEDPLMLVTNKTRPLIAAINIIDLANIYSCAFIATDDIGRFYEDGTFEVLGRMDNSDIRGCSLLSI